MTLGLPTQNKKQEPEDTGNVTHYFVLQGRKLHTLFSHHANRRDHLEPFFPIEQGQGIEQRGDVKE